MNMRLELLRGDTEVLELLQKDGWELQKTTRRDAMHLRHPKLTDDFETRHRLYRLGLLTSPALRIDLGPSSKRADCHGSSE